MAQHGRRTRPIRNPLSFGGGSGGGRSSSPSRSIAATAAAALLLLALTGGALYVQVLRSVDDVARHHRQQQQHRAAAGSHDDGGNGDSTSQQVVFLSEPKPSSSRLGKQSEAIKSDGVEEEEEAVAEHRMDEKKEKKRLKREREQQKLEKAAAKADAAELLQKQLALFRRNRPVPATADTLVISFPSSSEQQLGRIRIKLRDDLSPESVRHVRAVVERGTCSEKCKFYRAQGKSILQGIMSVPDAGPAFDPKQTVVKGQCPDEFAYFANKCAEHDPKCDCHGPIMTKGQVGWAGGGTGPDWFIDYYDRPVDWWGTTHTGTQTRSSFV